MCHLGVRGLVVQRLNQKCKHEAVFGADDYPGAVAVGSFQSSLTCSECGGEIVNVRPNWIEQPMQMRLTGKVWR